MIRAERDLLKLARGVWPTCELSAAGKHYRLTLHTPRGDRFVIVDKTPSDHRSQRNTVRDIRHELAAIGVLST